MRYPLLSSLIPLFLTVNGVLCAQEEYASMNRDQSLWQTLAMLAVIAVGFYFILWRPEQQRRKQLEDKRSSMRKGDRVTAMGIVGTVHQVKEETVVLKMIDGAKIEFLKGAINDVENRGERAEEESRDQTTN